jgi:endoglucanase
MRIARAVLARETEMRAGVRVLLAGPWARARGIVEPGYWAPRSFELLGRATGDRRFNALERGTIAVAAKLTANPPHLPADWATVSSKGAVAAIAAPPGHPRAPVQYSIDAARLPLRFAESCSQASRAVAAASWPLFAREGPAQIAVSYGLDGSITNPDQTAITLLGAAGAAHAAGVASARDALFAQAQAIDARFPTYYGAAWLALSQIELTTTALGSCA